MPRPKGFVMAQSQRENIRAAKQAYHDAHQRPMAEVNYHNHHRWLRSRFPKARKCEQCSREGPTDYALLPGREHSRERSDYAELCRSCHWKPDGRTVPPKRQPRRSP